jgi:hypothetical protein
MVTDQKSVTVGAAILTIDNCCDGGETGACYQRWSPSRVYYNQNHVSIPSDCANAVA